MRFRPFLILLAVAASLFAGCLSKPAVRREYFYLSPAATTNTPSNKTPVAESVALRSVIVSAPFAGRSLVYRVSETSYEVDPYAEYLVVPERMLGESTREWWRRTGTFTEVLEPEHRHNGARVAELLVTELYGDFRPNQEPAAALALRFTLRPARSSSAGTNDSPATIHRQVSRRVKLREKTAAGVAEGLQQALGDALHELSGSLAEQNASK
jgi:hypothetical protein